MSDFFLIPSVFGYWVFGSTKFLFDKCVLRAFYLVVLHSSFALPSLFLRFKAGITTSDSVRPV